MQKCFGSTMSSSLCGKCKKSCQDDAKTAVCTGPCKNSFHLHCTDMKTRGELEKKKSWKCTQCSDVMVEPSLADLMKALKSTKEDLGRSIESCHQKLDESKKILEEQGKRLIECLDKIESLDLAVTSLERENVSLKARINDLEQYGRKNSVEIQGVPLPVPTSTGAQPRENAIEVVHRIGAAVGFQFQPYTIDACHRLGKVSNRSQPPGIIVKFTCRVEKESFMQKVKSRRDFSTRHVNGFENFDQRIFVNDNLTEFNKMLFKKAREFKKANNFLFVWYKNGKILLRKTEKGKVFVISSLDDLKLNTVNVNDQ